MTAYSMDWPPTGCLNEGDFQGVRSAFINGDIQRSGNFRVNEDESANDSTIDEVEPWKADFNACDANGDGSVCD